jgi:hypothetical protein
MGYQEGGGVSEFEQMLNNAPAGSPDLASIPDAIQKFQKYWLKAGLK